MKNKERTPGLFFEIDFKPAQPMIKAKMKNGDLIFGLSAENIKNLKKGLPILIQLKEMGLEDRRIVIAYGETEQAIYQEMQPFLDSSTKIHGERPRAEPPKPTSTIKKASDEENE